MLELILQALYSGLLAGGYYAMIALGLALVFGTMRIINLAHGELVLLAAYVAFEMERSFGWTPLASIPVALVVVGLTALVIYLLIGRIRQDRELNSLILTFGIAIVLTNLILMIWSADIRSTSNSWFMDGVVLGDTLFSMRGEVIFCVIGVLLLAATYWWLNHTWQGRALRAVASNRDAAKLMGVNPARIEALSFLVSGVLATFAGVAVYTASVVFPAVGHNLTIKAFVITVLAGMGSVPGVLLGAVLIGVGETLTTTLAKPSLQELTGMVIFLLILFLRPSGLFGRKGMVKK
ncbi:branched-chain amino acid ABC transporter permease [Insolitispirillum peregrinum]|uniref:Amino acid/amide ABC transporter membrane protein 1, HAAT family n=1 Tax=Insolitispirillum peregrinum TaxID=80876 RepID=A0A1N7KZQ7_9PROT|nr:branched-chain amino acid ABC transporter permease [Insolitispirillum peregrinum]SIS67099.1 amino acid/amide ABC transporter membrane protein 1, HAAT family [Insolitispirillum peregrinum]